MPALNSTPADDGCSKTNVLPDGGDGRREAGVEGGDGGDAEDPGEEEARVGHRAGEGDAGAAGVRMRAWQLFFSH